MKLSTAIWNQLDTYAEDYQGKSIRRLGDQAAFKLIPNGAGEPKEHPYRWLQDGQMIHFWGKRLDGHWNSRFKGEASSDRGVACFKAVRGADPEYVGIYKFKGLGFDPQTDCYVYVLERTQAALKDGQKKITSFFG